jgi:hypothetical protein
MLFSVIFKPLNLWGQNLNLGRNGLIELSQSFRIPLTCCDSHMCLGDIVVDLVGRTDS